MTNWGRVYYTNFLSAIALLLVFPFCKEEHQLLKEFEFSTAQLLLLTLSCAVGVCMSHAGDCCVAGWANQHQHHSRQIHNGGADDHAHAGSAEALSVPNMLDMACACCGQHCSADLQQAAGWTGF